MFCLVDRLFISFKNTLNNRGTIWGFIMLDELNIIKIAETYLKNDSDDIIKGIGDDTAVIKEVKGKQLLTSDMLIEGTHFLLDKITPFDLGWKSLAVNISDIASMSGNPTFALLSLGLNKKITYEWLVEFYKGLASCAEAYKVKVIGGDTVSAPNDIVINISLLGKADKPIYRDNIKENYILTTTGYLGLSGLGFWLLTNKKDYTEAETYCINKHVKPLPRVEEGLFLGEKLTTFAMMDCSDGLYSSCKTFCEQNELGITLYQDNLPIAEELAKTSTKYHLKPLDFILYGGEDYELIIAMPIEEYELIKKVYLEKFSFELPLLGKFNKNINEICLISNKSSVILKDKSFKHF